MIKWKGKREGNDFENQVTGSSLQNAAENDFDRFGPENGCDWQMQMKLDTKMVMEGKWLFLEWKEVKWNSAICVRSV